MNRAEALRALIEHANANDWPTAEETTGGPLYVVGIELLSGARRAFGGSLDAGATLEAPLRERGWEGPSVDAPGCAHGDVLDWLATWRTSDNPGPRDLVLHGEAPTEPRARLLAVLRALLWEAESEATVGETGATKAGAAA